MENSLKISNLTKQYDGFHLDHINLNLKQGSIMGFIGENGAGKSTTIKSIINLVHPDEGDIEILGMNMKENESAIKEQIGVVFDECHFHDSLTSLDINLFMSKIYSNWDEKIYFNYLKRFKIPEKKIIKEYSRGMKMKLSIAVALSHNPKLLLLDEATSGLDPVIRNEILDVFYDFIQDEEHSILMSSHITSDLEQIADYITFIHEGKIVFSDSKDNILDNYAVIKCSKADFTLIDSSYIVGTRNNSYSYEILTNRKSDAKKNYKNLVIDSASLEDIMLFYGKGGVEK
ncbi:ABC-2 type transport system ATP-binding protein [Mobilisporobacter senegalensis]|uniref:ABC-2 type transport system ATP-binding protein n=1 Tax=Mobilisporobacter senegalensis TaxID=1329262 RepID=A0A3N1XGB4_9FIRM|nr:ABC transporter ATP-binding protein [Mobilisporobacter senegalensis]ROR25760.1 ABC-2 type transport system ATP-binding protein [Mobilisporobacter senegalensis]